MEIVTPKQRVQCLIRFLAHYVGVALHLHMLLGVVLVVGRGASQQSAKLTKKSLEQPEKMTSSSVKQPWAGLIMAGIKTVENRSWSTNYSGRLAVVSTKQPDKIAMETMREKLGTLPDICSINGAILGTVNLDALIWEAEDGVEETDAENVDMDNINQWWHRDCFGWLVSDPQPIKPIPHKGRLGLYEIPDKLAVGCRSLFSGVSPD